MLHQGFAGNHLRMMKPALSWRKNTIFQTWGINQLPSNDHITSQPLEKENLQMCFRKGYVRSQEGTLFTKHQQESRSWIPWILGNLWNKSLTWQFRPFWGQDSLTFHYLLGWPFPARKVAIDCLDKSPSIWATKMVATWIAPGLMIVSKTLIFLAILRGRMFDPLFQQHFWYIKSMNPASTKNQQPAQHHNPQQQIHNNTGYTSNSILYG